MQITVEEHRLSVAQNQPAIKMMLTAELQYSPIYSGFILQIESASQRPSREFDVDRVRNHYCWSVFMLHSRLLSKYRNYELASAVRLCYES